MYQTQFLIFVLTMIGSPFQNNTLPKNVGFQLPDVLIWMTVSFFGASTCKMRILSQSGKMVCGVPWIAWFTIRLANFLGPIVSVHAMKSTILLSPFYFWSWNFLECTTQILYDQFESLTRITTVDVSVHISCDWLPHDATLDKCWGRPCSWGTTLTGWS